MIQNLPDDVIVKSLTISGHNIDATIDRFGPGWRVAWDGLAAGAWCDNIDEAITIARDILGELDGLLEQQDALATARKAIVARLDARALALTEKATA